jgi:hypothetical protein
MDNSQFKSRAEDIADIVIFVPVTLYLTSLLLSLVYCSVTADGCHATVIAHIVILMGWIMLMGPVILIAFIVSLYYKIVKYSAGFRPRTKGEIEREVVMALELIFVLCVILSPVFLAVSGL